MGYIIARDQTYIRVKEDGRKYYNSDEREKATEFICRLDQGIVCVPGAEEKQKVTEMDDCGVDRKRNLIVDRQTEKAIIKARISLSRAIALDIEVDTTLRVLSD